MLRQQSLVLRRKAYTGKAFKNQKDFIGPDYITLNPIYKLVQFGGAKQTADLFVFLSSFLISFVRLHGSCNADPTKYHTPA
jgi:hypothetical protein